MPEKKIVVVHEDAVLIEQIKQVLGESDVEVINILSGPRALGVIEAQRPDVVVVDAELEGMDGYTLTQQIKAGAGAAAPVLILSLAPNEASAMRARQAGAAAHMASSAPTGQIVDKVLALLGQAAPPAAAPAPVPAVGGVDAVREPMGAGIPQPVTPAAAPGATPTESMGSGVPQPVAAPMGSGVPQPVGAQPAGGAPQPPAAPIPPTISEPPSAAGPPGSDVPHIDDLLRLMLNRGGSDLHITVGSPPGIRQRGEIVPVENMKPLMPRDTMEMLLNLLSEEQRRRFETELELDFAYSIPGVSRFRANIFQQRNSMGAVFRVIPLEIPTLEQLNLPKVARLLAERPRGLVLVTGPTGSGKSTTLAAMIDHINETRPLHIITMEDPIEFMHKNKRSYLNQREVGEDTHSFSAALKRVLRQDPDVILVGEMRDLETIGAAITAAETGHLVLATLHTTGGPATVDRIIDVFPPHQQQQVRMQLSNTLEGVLSQVLLRSTDGRSRVMAMEIMLGIPAIRNLIREGKTHQMDTIIQGGGNLGMQTLDQHLRTLLQAGKVTFEEAIGKAQNPRELANAVGRKI
ncbi:MAG: PilT/PilU family type 4a pilus ATPase [Coriobacteriia bacterium]